MEIEHKIIFKIQDAFKSLYDIDPIAIGLEDLKIEPTKSSFEGNYSFVVFPYLRQSKKKPEETAEEIGAYLSANVPEIGSYNIVKGFLNLSLSQEFWAAYLNQLLAKPMYGKGNLQGKVMVEYSSPNTNKPLHLGHIRNILLGYSVSEIMKFAGLDVVKANLINDRGIHICKSMYAWEQMGNGETPESSGLKGDHLVGKYYVQFDKLYKLQIAELIASGKTEEEAKKQAPCILAAQEMLLKWENGDVDTVALWKKMNDWVYAGFDITYNRMGVNFDAMYYESDTYLLGKEFVEKGLQNGVFFKKEDGSIWVDLTEEGLDEKLLLRADGTSVYMTQDMGTAQKKYDDYGCEKSIYVVGNEQEYHFKVLQLIMQKLNKPYAPGIFHLSYGMVELPDGKMKSREGTVVDADDLMEEMKQTARHKTEELGKTDGMSQEEMDYLFESIGQAALKYYLLKVDPKRKMLFNPEDSIDFQGDTGPFVQYTFARIQSILANTEGKKEHATNIDLAPSEINIVQHLKAFPKKIEDSAIAYSPAIVANYVFDLAKLYNKFYNELSILGEQDPDKKQFRINICCMVSETLEQGLRLLGINAPKRM
jgi:arginyl-tRNA synthetase